MSLTHRYRRLPLRAKLSLWVSLGVSVIVVALIVAMLLALEQTTRRSVAQVQAALVEAVVRDVDSNLDMRRDALVFGGAVLGERLQIREGAEVEEYFASRPLLRRDFSTVLLVDLDGRVVYSSGSPQPGQPRRNLSDRAYFKEVLRTGEPVIAGPLISKIAPVPLMTFSAPVRHRDGRITGVLVGLLRLDQANFISDVSASRIGDAGYVVLTTQGSTPSFIAHPQPGRVMQAVPGGADPGLAAARQGAAETVEGVDGNGTAALFTRRTLHAAPWTVEAVYPTAEAFAGLRTQQRQIVAVGASIVVASGLLVWWLTTTLLAPMDKLRRALHLDATGSENMLQDVEADSADMAALLEAYYAQKSRRLATETALDASERRLRSIADNLPAFVAYFDKEGCYRYVNAQYRTVFGIDPAAMLGKTIAQGLGEAAYSIVRPHVAAVLAGQAQSFECAVAGHPGVEHLLVSYVPDIGADGEVAGFHSMTLDITGRKKAELLLSRSELRLKAITDSVPAMIAVVDRTQRYRFANARFQSSMGIEPDALIGLSMCEFLGSVAYAELLPEIEGALRGERRQFERTGWKHNAEMHFFVEYVPEVATDGELAGFVVMVLDITERKRMELALAQSEQRVRTIADNLPAMISHFDRDLRYTFANATVGRMFDCASASLIGRTLRDVRGEAGFAVVAPWVSRALAGETVSFETTYLRSDALLQHFEANYIPEVDAAGQVVGLYVLTFEVTERKQKEAQLRASQQLLDRTGAIAGIGGWSLDIASGTVSWTSETRRIHEVDDGFEPTLDSGRDFYADDALLAIEQAVRNGLASGTPWDLVLPLRTARGRSIWARTTGEVEFDADGKAQRLFGALQDVSQRVEHEHELREQAELLQVTLQSIGDGVITADERGCVRWMNPAAERMTGWTSEAASGRPTAEVFRIVHAETRMPAPDPATACLTTLDRTGLAARTVLLSTSGQEFAIEDCASPIHDVKGGLRGAVLVFHDVSEQRRMTDQMTYRATHDALTGLLNRAEFEARLTRVLAKACDEKIDCAMMFIDLDQFKLVNDACGHAMGDKLLCQVSELLRMSVRNRDTLGRLGGDEFGVILEHCTVQQAERVAQSICDRMDEFRFVHDDRRFRIGASIGLVPVDGRWSDTVAAQRAADTACYAAKEAGRNRVHVWFDSDAAMRGQSGETQWASRLEEALDDDDFVLYAQKIQPMQSRVTGLHCEILIRLREADGTIVAPGRFLPAAERFHMASRIDRWMVRRVFEWLAEENGSPADIETVSVNLSGQSLGDRAFHRYVVQLLQEIAVDPTKLCFEVTETAAITNLADASAFIREMRALGMRVALDDFGAGASSFGYLKNLPVDYLKIDGQFIRDIETDPLDMAAVRCFHEVARAIGVQTIAEFVETESIRQVLCAIGIDYAQGYLIHRPEPLEDLLRSVRAGGNCAATPSCDSVLLIGN